MDGLAGIANYCFVFVYETLFAFVVDPLKGTPMVALPLLAGGGVLAGLSYLFKTHQILGYGFPTFLERINVKNGVLSIRETLVKTLGAVVTLGFGGSAGQEGPIAQIGGGIGSTVGRMLRVSRNYSRIFVACGVAGAIAATFNAPVAGVLFAEEIALIRDFRIGSFIPIVISSAVGTVVSHALRGNEPLFTVPPYHFVGYSEFVAYGIFGVATGVCGYLFIKLFYFTKDKFDSLTVTNHLKPVIGGLILAVIGIACPYVLGNGYDGVSQVLHGELSLWLVLALVVLKPLATSITLGSGWPGGVFAPSIFVGTVVGSAYGVLVRLTLASTVPLESAYATIGMGAFLAAVTQAPLTSIFLIFEMTHNYQVVIPIMIASVIASAITRFLAGGSLESIELKRRGIDIEEGMEKHILRSITVEEVMTTDIETIREDERLRDVIEYLPRSRHTTFPVVDQQGRLTGIISIQDFREWIFEESLKDLVVVKEIATPKVITVTPEDTLDKVLDKWGRKPVEILPVVDPSDPGKLVGILSRRDVIAAYNKALSTKALEERL